MEDFRFLQDNSVWIIIIALFVLLFLGNGNGCNSFGGDFGNLFGGCGNNSWVWIILIILAICLLTKNDCGGIFRNDLQ
ncbi:MAG: hypothetical protein J6F30_12945 [Cellulosilyticum sp.]|nr:hypothetical protein [Cellulosilyticum sp.]